MKARSKDEILNELVPDAEIRIKSAVSVPSGLLNQLKKSTISGNINDANSWSDVAVLSQDVSDEVMDWIDQLPTLRIGEIEDPVSDSKTIPEGTFERDKPDWFTKDIEKSLAGFDISPFNGRIKSSTPQWFVLDKDGHIYLCDTEGSDHLRYCWKFGG